MIRRTFMQLVAVAIAAMTCKPHWRVPQRVFFERIGAKWPTWPVSRFYGAVGTVNRSPVCGFASETMVVAGWCVDATDKDGNVVERVELRPYSGLRFVDVTTGKTVTYQVDRVADWPSFEGFVEVQQDGCAAVCHTREKIADTLAKRNGLS